MSSAWEQAMDLAASAAREAGERLVSLANAELTVLAEEKRDIKLAADREAEALIVHRLQESGFAILAEEGGAYGDLASDAPVWVVDPLDGTMNFSRGIPICCVSIALMQSGEPIIGVVYDFNRNECFTGIVDSGAWLNGVPMSVSQVSSADRAILAAGLPANRDYSPEALAPLAEAMGRFRKVRMLGSAAVMLAYVAAGRIDAYCEDDIKLWDVAAGLALVRGAGGYAAMTSSDRGPWNRCVRAASRASVWGVQ